MGKIIITGSKGLLGSEISNYLRKGNDIFELDLTLGHDLTDEKFVKEWFFNNKADYLVNCFALNDHVNDNSQNQDLFNIKLSELTDYININVIALFSVCREFSKNNSSKGIVNFSSTYGIVSPLPELYKNGEKHIGYSISKGAVIQLTRHLAVHFAPKVRVNCLVPGGVENNQSSNFIKEYSSKTPLKRMMKKNELNGIIELLCSDKSSYMTGSIITVDGGWTAQ